MRLSVIRLLGVFLVLGGVALIDAKGAPPDVIPGGARWEWTLGMGKNKDSGTFKGFQDGTIRFGKDQEQIGKWTPVGTDSVRLKINKGKLEGEVVLKRVVNKKDPKIITFEGILRKKGKDEKLYVELFKD